MFKLLRCHETVTGHESVVDVWSLRAAEAVKLVGECHV